MASSRERPRSSCATTSRSSSSPCGPRLECLVDRAAPDRFATRSVAMARHGMVATSQPLATEIGVATLRRGGSAVDAAIAANAALGLTEPTSCGIGGDLFAIVWDAASERLHGLNASGRSPLSLTLDRLLGMGLALIPDRGPLSVSVPGAVDGWCELHARFGRLPLRELLAPSIAYAREGFPVTEVIGASWAAGASALQGQSRLCRGVHAERPSARDRRAVRESGARASVRAHCERGPWRVLRRPDCGGHRRLRAGQRRVLGCRGSCGASLRVGRAGVYDVSRLERLRAPAERSRHRRVADAEHPRGFRSRVARVG